MSELKTYLDNLYFSLFIIFVGFIGLYIVLYVLSIALEPAGISFNMDSFSIYENFTVLLLLWIILSCTLAAVLTVRSVRNRPKDAVVFTKRKQL